MAMLNLPGWGVRCCGLPYATVNIRRPHSPRKEYIPLQRTQGFFGGLSFSFLGPCELVKTGLSGSELFLLRRGVDGLLECGNSP